jgi:hypothetical protein
MRVPWHGEQLREKIDAAFGDLVGRKSRPLGRARERQQEERTGDGTDGR